MDNSGKTEWHTNNMDTALTQYIRLLSLLVTPIGVPTIHEPPNYASYIHYYIQWIYLNIDDLLKYSKNNRKTDKCTMPTRYNQTQMKWDTLLLYVIKIL